MRSSPQPSRPISAARPGSTPSSPSNIGRATKSAVSSSNAFSGVTTMQCRVLVLDSTMSLLPFAGHTLGLFLGLVDAANVHERTLGQMVPLAFAQLFEAPQGFLNWSHLAFLAGERLGHDERLRQELLNPPRPVHHLLVVLAQFLDAEDGDNVPKFAVALEDLPHLAGDGKVFLADVLGREDVAVRRQRIDGWVNTLFGYFAFEVEKGVEVLESVRRGWIGRVVGGDVHGLH